MMKSQMMYLTSFICSLFCSIFLLTSCENGQTGSDVDKEGTIVYEESDEVFPNPERGFYQHVGLYSGANTVLTTAAIETQRKQSITLFYTVYYMMDFIQSDISDEFLERIEKSMKALRAGGAKCILRFAYRDSEADKPWDPTQEQVARHIEQITPYLQEYADVIYCMQAGFVGVWGEWYYTTHFNMNPSTAQDFAPRRAVLDALLCALPRERMVAVRTPQFKIKCYDLALSDTLTMHTAFSGSDLSRIAAHNDCFLASGNDYGTYTFSMDRPFWQADTRYTIMGGETCNPSNLSGFDNAVVEMVKYHWSYLNRGYHQGVLSSWMTGGDMDFVKRNLGYRLVLRKAWFTDVPVANGDFEAEFEIENIGFASPCNPRRLELVFVSKDDAKEKHVCEINDVDPRYWFAGETHEFSVNYKLPAVMKGKYDVYLNLPDPKTTLRDNPKFSIRLGNKDIWEETTGYNKVTEITID